MNEMLTASRQSAVTDDGEELLEARLSEELQKQLSEYSQDITKGLNEAFKDLAEQGVKELQQGKPYHNRTGQYAKNFAVTQRKTASTVQGAESYTIYNKKRYNCTSVQHLPVH